MVKPGSGGRARRAMLVIEASAPSVWGWLGGGGRGAITWWRDPDPPCLSGGVAPKLGVVLGLSAVLRACYAVSNNLAGPRA